MAYRQKFIDQVKDGAIRGWEKYQILPSLTISQAILESDWGRSGLAVQGNNLFGVKGSYKGNSVTMKTKEYIDGKWITVDAAFAKYPDQATSVEEHGAFFGSTNWRRENYKHVFGETDYKKAVRAILTPKAGSGYATDPDYDTKIINIIEQYNLTQYDKGINQEVEKMAVVAKPAMVDRRKQALGFPSRTSAAGNRRSVASINRIAFHYTATTTGSITGHENFWRNNRGWGLGGYTYYIARNGTIYWNYDHAVRTNGVGGHNTRTLNISVEASHKNNYTDAQVKSRDHLLAWLSQELNISHSNILQHKEFSGQSTACAGYTRAEANVIRNRINSLAKSGKVPNVITNAGATFTRKEHAEVKLKQNIMLRDKPNTKTGKHLKTAQKGEQLEYTEVWEGNGFRWVKLKSGEFMPYREESKPNDPWVTFHALTEEENRIQKYRGNDGKWRNMKVGDEVTIRAGHLRWLASDGTHMVRASQTFEGHVDTIKDVKDVKAGYSDKAYLLTELNSWILEQDLVEPRQKEGQPHIKDDVEGFKKEEVLLEEVEDKEAKPENLIKDEIILDGKVWKFVGSFEEVALMDEVEE